jgi:hypothetical protein
MLDNARDLSADLDWFSLFLDMRLKSHFATKGSDPIVAPPTPPDLSESNSCYARFLQHYELTPQERLVLLLAMIPHIRPQLLDLLWSTNEATGRGFSEFGGLNGLTHGGFIPSGETAAFIVAGDDLEQRFQLSRLFEGDHFFGRHAILSLAPVAAGEPLLSGALAISMEYLSWFTSGTQQKPNYSSEFPARLIETELDWEFLVLPNSTMEQLEEIKQWILHGEKLLQEWGMRAKLQPGFTSLFHGPPGTGKTLSACLLGKHCECDVYRIDLGLIVSKYIGETEKNLARVFDMAEDKKWILFFDEADALFGKRTTVDDSHDRYANQEVSFLLQRIEQFNGVVILASNLKANIDNAFLRRFHSVIAFPMPRPAERLRIWQCAFSPQAALAPDVDLAVCAEKYDVSGGTIMNVVRYASLMALSRGKSTILREDLEEGLRREYQKEGRTI